MDMTSTYCGNDSESAPKQPQLTSDGLDRPIKPSDISFIAECDYITQHWNLMGWLMLKSSGCTIADIRKNVMELFPHTSDSVKVIHLIEQWQLSNKNEATARALVDICCHPVVGGVRELIEDLLIYESSSHSGKQNINQCRKFVCIFLYFL